MTAALLRERISPIREMPPPYSSFDYRPTPMPCQHPDIEPLKADVNALILLARSFEIRLDSTDEQWKHQFKQSAFLLESVSDLKSRLDKLDAEKFLVARRVATCKFSMICVVLCTTILWALYHNIEYPHTESIWRTLT
jgi:hypothetical protein